MDKNYEKERVRLKKEILDRFTEIIETTTYTNEELQEYLNVDFLGQDYYNPNYTFTLRLSVKPYESELPNQYILCFNSIPVQPLLFIPRETRNFLNRLLGTNLNERELSEYLIDNFLVKEII